MSHEATGCLAIVLHAHLPFVRHPENERHLEEFWLFEAVAECYLPLLQMIQRLITSGVRARFAISFSHTLCAMLQDPLLRARCKRHLEELLELSAKEVHRTQWLADIHPTAVFYFERFKELNLLYESIGSDILGAFKEYRHAGIVELFTTSATHAVLPLLVDAPGSLNAQIFEGHRLHQRLFDAPPQGIWLPECAYTPGLEAPLRAAGYQWFVVDTHGILNATPSPARATFAPVRTPNGIFIFGRDRTCAEQVWSRNIGYPGDARYREFYRDMGFDGDMDYVRPYLGAADVRGFTGIKYHRITGPGPDKQPYSRLAALAGAEEHATHFTNARRSQLAEAAQCMSGPPIVMAPYDAELFGHWWFEGPEFLENVFRKCAAQGSGIELVTPSDYLAMQPDCETVVPAASTWGRGGHMDMWLNEQTEYIRRELRLAEQKLTNAVRNESAPQATHILDAAARELMLAQASDWPFLISSGTNAQYAAGRFHGHMKQFAQLLAAASGPAYQDVPEVVCPGLLPNLESTYWANLDSTGRLRRGSATYAEWC